MVEDIRSAKWMKLVSNATTLVTTAILGIPMLEANACLKCESSCSVPDRRPCGSGPALGHRVLPIFGLAAADMRDRDSVVETLLDTLFGGFVLPTTRTTVLQDWVKGRRSEVDDINGAVVAAGERFGFPTPVNSAVVEIAHRIERKQWEP